MNSNIKELWVAALSNGTYVQGVSAYLCCQQAYVTPKCFSFLGVLCDIHAQMTDNVWKFTGGDPHLYLGHNSFLPDEVVSWAELSGLEVNHLYQISANMHFKDVAKLIATKILG